MSKRLTVLWRVKQLIQIALPGARVMGLDGEDAAPAIIPPAGMVVVRSGDPGEPEYTFSPMAYHYEHRIPIEVSTARSHGLTSEEALDVMLVAIGQAVATDRTLGGLCDWLDTSAAGTDDIAIEAAGKPPRGADLMIMASYSTPNPLT
ncbi:hypothetical protein [Sphingomonas sp. Leaf17]|uniref:hypothetical protein n=1 Tax=Sphingomonas sp. Leaf17 TaxID=1735683 RepID=UPI00190FFD9B|nr:hypothetical protein [Sphingomonas sp. Leaf17]